jgi:ornithine carbamoyltransferase
MDVRIGAPRQLWPSDEHVAMCRDFAVASGARITITDDPKEAVSGVDFIYTDVWVSMGEPMETWGERIDLLLPFQVNPELMAAASKPRVKFMHCLPAFHNSETKVGAEIAAQYPFLTNGVEVTDDVFESPANIAFDQAENRMHTIKAVLVAALS